MVEHVDRVTHPMTKALPKAVYISEYFDLTRVQHPKLFTEGALLWEVIQQLPSYLALQKLGVIEVPIPQGVFLENAHLISIGEGSVIEPGAYIKGPCLIGKRCTIRHGAYIRGNLLAEDDCVIGHDTEIKDSIMLSGAKAAHFAYLGNSILGFDVNLGAGTKCANLKLDQGNIKITVEGKALDTGMRKLGAFVGDGAQLGCNCVPNPGTLIGKGARCFPCTNFGGVVPKDAVVRPAARAVVKLPVK